MWEIYGSRSEYLNADAQEAERHRLVWTARMLAQNEEIEKTGAKAKSDADEAAHDAAIGW